MREVLVLRAREQSVLTRRGWMVPLLGLLLSACASTPKPVPYVAPEDDPALSSDPGVAAQAMTTGWRWEDSARRWFTTEQHPAQVGIDGWVYEQDALRLRIMAPAQLNLYLNRPHALVLRIIQLSDQKPFSERSKTRFGLQEMLTLDSFDPAVVGVTHLILLPGSDQIISIDRQANARFIGVVAGYYRLDGKTATRMVPLVGQDDTPPADWRYTWSFGLFGEASQPLPPRPVQLKMLLDMGSDQLDDLRIHAQ